MRSEHFVSELAISSSFNCVELVAIALSVDQMVFGVEIDYWVEGGKHCEGEGDVNLLISFLRVSNEC